MRIVAFPLINAQCTISDLAMANSHFAVWQMKTENGKSEKKVQTQNGEMAYISLTSYVGKITVA